MRIVILMEDTCGNPLCEYEHGLSVYVETEKHKILVDTGASGKTLKNAEKLGIDLSGVDKRIAGLSGVRLLDGDFRLDEELSVFTGITGRRFWPEGNGNFSMQEGGQRVPDGFCHEQCLVVQGDRNLLVSGCAHNGILNILDTYEEKYGGCPDAVVSGFHMVKKTDYTEQGRDTICRTAEELRRTGAVFYTGHCTGQKAMELMQPIMGGQMVPIRCGTDLLL